VSNLEKRPGTVLCESGPAADVELLEPRDVPLGGPRAMTVRRTLPQRARSLIGAWCFLDHYGPDDVRGQGGMHVPPHPHTGLATVSWLFAGEIEHRDSTGAHALVRPGELNLMTAGRGIQHSEVSTDAVTVLHGAQLWLALPDAHRHREPFFERYVPEPAPFGDATLRIFIGSLAGSTSPATTFTPLLGAQLDLPAGASIELPVDPAFEHGLLVDAGAARFEGHPVASGVLAYAPTGRSSLRIEATDAPVRALLLGGEPLGERIVMWWNFVGRSHDEIVEYRAHWQADGIARRSAGGWFGVVEGFDGDPLPAPMLPNVRLAPRG
jgi:redox-sensitive bicupin YhaK (pirin superfamily)